MTALVLRVRDQLVVDGLAEVEDVYPEGDARRVGAIVGFRLCQALETPEEYQAVLLERQRREFSQKCDLLDGGDVRDYWLHRYATLQVEYVYDRLRVLWQIGPTYSAAAVVKVADVLERIEA